jgi:hypothetical protein
LEDYDAIVDACCNAWNALSSMLDRLCFNYPAPLDR